MNGSERYRESDAPLVVIVIRRLARTECDQLNTLRSRKTRCEESLGARSPRSHRQPTGRDWSGLLKCAPQTLQLERVSRNELSLDPTALSGSARMSGPVSRPRQASHGGPRRRIVRRGQPVTAFELTPIGRVESSLTSVEAAPRQADEGAPDAWLVFEADVREALRGLRVGQGVVVITWFDRARRNVLSIHPAAIPPGPPRASSTPARLIGRIQSVCTKWRLHRSTICACRCGASKRSTGHQWLTSSLCWTKTSASAEPSGRADVIRAMLAARSSRRWEAKP